MEFLSSLFFILFSYFLQITASSSSSLTATTSTNMFWKDTGDNCVVDAADKRVVRATDSDVIVVSEQTIAPSSGHHKYAIKVIESAEPRNIYVGIAPVGDVDPAASCALSGWYLHVASATLISGPPHNYSATPMPLAAGEGIANYAGNLFAGDVITLDFDATVGSLAFSINRKNVGVAYTGIPLDKPFVVAAMLGENDVIRLEVVDNSSTAPTSFHTTSVESNAVALAWRCDDASLPAGAVYRVSCEYSESGYAGGAVAPIVYEGSAAECSVKGLIAGVSYDFYVTRSGSDVWSAPLRVTTTPAKAFSEARLLRNSVEGRGIEVAEGGLSAVSKGAGSWHALLADAVVPREGKRRFGVKIVSLKGSSADMLIGVAPADIDPNFTEGHPTYGWFFSCYRSNIVSGPPHNASYLNYDPARTHVQTGDLVEVFCETVAAEGTATLSFAVNGKALGPAFLGIPLDKPLVPVVLMRNDGDAVEFISEN